MEKDKAVTRKTAQQRQQKLLTEGSTQSPQSVSVSSSPLRLSVTVLDLTAMEKRILASFDSLLESKLEPIRKSIIATLNARIDSINSKCENLAKAIADIDVRLSELESSSNEDVAIREVNRFQRLSDVVISGIPFVENEQPDVIYNNIAQSINITLSPFKHAFRLRVKPKPNNSVKANAPIIVKLSHQAERNTLFDAIRRRNRSLKLCDINCGFISEQKISIFESLLPHDDTIRKKANRLRKEGKLHSVKTVNGVVHIKCNEAEPPVKVTSMEQLFSLISHPTKSDTLSPSCNIGEQHN